MWDLINCYLFSSWSYSHWLLLWRSYLEFYKKKWPRAQCKTPRLTQYFYPNEFSLKHSISYSKRLFLSPIASPHNKASTITFRRWQFNSQDCSHHYHCIVHCCTIHFSHRLWCCNCLSKMSWWLITFIRLLNARIIEN